MDEGAPAHDWEKTNENSHGHQESHLVIMPRSNEPMSLV